MKGYPGFVIAVAFGCGLLLGVWIPAGLAALPGALGLAILVVPPVLARGSARLREAAIGWQAVLRILAVVCLGTWRGVSPSAPPPALPRLAVVVGFVLEPPVEGVEDNGGVRTLHTSLGLALEGTGRTVKVRVQGLLRGVRGGDRVRAAGRLSAPPAATNPGEVPTSGEPLLWVPHPRGVRVLEPPRWPPPGRVLGLLRGKIVELCLRMYPERMAGFIISMILGDRRLLPPDIRDALTYTGTYHLLAISGLHVVLLMFLVLRIPLHRTVRWPCRLVFLAGFTLLTGASPPVVRAALMFGLGALAERCRRSPRALNTLGWTAFLILAWSPQALRDVGFQLSFIAVLSILSWGVCLSEGLERRGKARLLLAPLAVSLGTCVGTTPITAYYFQRVHLLGPIWNLLAYPLTVIPLAGGLASIALGAIHPSLGAPVAWIVNVACEGLIVPLAAAARLPGSSVAVPNPSPVLVVAACGILAAGILVRRRAKQRAVALAVALALLILACAAARWAPRRPTVWQFAVGEGGSALLAVPGAGCFVLDAGSKGTDARARNWLPRTILATGNKYLRGAVLTHFHQDHTRGLAGLAERLAVPELWTSAPLARAGSGRRFLQCWPTRPPAAREIARGCRLEFPGAPGFDIEVLHPHRDEPLIPAGDENNLSLVLRIGRGERSFLSLGDLEEAGIARLLREEKDLRAGVILAPHHGHFHDLWPEIIQRALPRAVVISGSGEPKARQTAEWLEARGTRVFATWRKGAVLIEWKDKEGWTPRYWHDGSSLLSRLPSGAAPR